MPERLHPTPRPPADARETAPGALRAVGHVLRGAAAAVAGLVYPDLCLGCDRRVPARDDGDALAGLPLCPTCLAALPPAPDAGGATLADAVAAGVVSQALALWTYDAGGTVRRVQHALKYGGHERIGRPLGHLIGAAWKRAGGGAAPGEPGPDLVVPVPLASVRLLERGYNQAAALAAGAAAALGAESRTDRLVRTRSTRSQTALTAEERRGNVGRPVDRRRPARPPRRRRAHDGRDARRRGPPAPRGRGPRQRRRAGRRRGVGQIPWAARRRARMARVVRSTIS
jgi:predicted amidophosphoribosyltransferase